MKTLLAMFLSLFIGTAAFAQEAAPAAAPAPAPAPAALDPENILYLDLSTGGRVSILMRPDIRLPDGRHSHRLEIILQFQIQTRAAQQLHSILSNPHRTRNSR